MPEQQPELAWQKIINKNPYCLLGLTYEEVLSFVPPSFDEDEMES